MTGLYFFVWRGEKLFTAIQTRKQLLGLMVGACLVTTNWTAYLVAVQIKLLNLPLIFYLSIDGDCAGHVCFLVLMVRWLALLVATIGVLIKATQLDGMPYLALLIGASFAVYAVVRKQINIDAFAGMVRIVDDSLSNAGLSGLSELISKSGQGSFFLDGSSYGMIMALASGIVTSVPLVLFHVGNRYLHLNIAGFLFYINPSLQLIIGVLLFGEDFVRWGYASVWLHLDGPAFSICKAARRKYPL